jgi:hypothetical protein
MSVAEILAAARAKKRLVDRLPRRAGSSWKSWRKILVRGSDCGIACRGDSCRGDSRRGDSRPGEAYGREVGAGRRVAGGLDEGSLQLIDDIAGYCRKVDAR